MKLLLFVKVRGYEHSPIRSERRCIWDYAKSNHQTVDSCTYLSSPSLDLTRFDEAFILSDQLPRSISRLLGRASDGLRSVGLSLGGRNQVLVLFNKGLRVTSRVLSSPSGILHGLYFTFSDSGRSGRGVRLIGARPNQSLVLLHHAFHDGQLVLRSATLEPPDYDKSCRGQSQENRTASQQSISYGGLSPVLQKL